MEFLKKISNFLNTSDNSSLYSEKVTDFTRENKLVFSSVVLMILHSFKDSVEYNLLTFLPKLISKPAKAPAFSIARYKIKTKFFQDVNNMVYEHIETIKPKLWKGYRLIAGDGTTVDLPPTKDNKKHFGTKGKSKCGGDICSATVCIIYDIFSNFILGAEIEPCKFGEITIMNRILEDYNIIKSIFIFDRGFGNFAMFKRLHLQGKIFCIRMKTSQSIFAEMVLADSRMDFITTWIPSYKEGENSKQHGFDIKPIIVRVTKIILKNGEIELLISNLFDLDKVTEKEMMELYNYRWAVEECIKKLKPKMKLEQFGCRKSKGVYQEFYAHIIMFNIVSIISHDAEDKINLVTKDRKYEYKYNFQTAFKLVRNKFFDLFFFDKIKESLLWLYENISQSLIAIVPERNFKRQTQFKNRNKPYYK